MQEEEQEMEPGVLTGIPNDAGGALDIEVTFHRGTAKQSGILFGSVPFIFLPFLCANPLPSHFSGLHS